VNKKGERHLSILVIDTGIGISSKVLPTIFEPFTLGDDSAARRYSGTGLGLTLTKQYVEYLGGNISFESIESIGTRCTIILPLTDPTEPTHQTSNRRSSCVLITPRAISQDERDAFALAGWDCHICDSEGLEAKEDSSSRVYFVDQAYGEFQDIIWNRLLRNSMHGLLISYGKRIVTEDGLKPEINCSVDRKAQSQLVAVVELEASTFPSEHDASSIEIAPLLTGKHILVADDNCTNLSTARMTLESIGHRVTLVSTGEDALSELDRSDYDLALIDMHMPGMSGIEVAKLYQFIVDTPRTPIVILTADATAEAKQAADESGAVAFLTKPLRAKELRAAVNVYARSDGIDGEQFQAVSINSSTTNAEPTLMIDVTELNELRAFGVSVQELTDMIHEFANDSRATIQTSLNACKKGDIVTARGCMHTLKGSAATIGAGMLHEIAREIEGMSRDELARCFEERHKDLHDTLTASVAKLFDELRECEVEET
jgi:two-component system sensor histidine kinase RpfC